MPLMPGADDDEPMLIAHSLAGSPEAYAALVNRYQSMVRAVAFRMTGSFNDSEELAQEAFLRAYRQLGSFGGHAKFSTWLCRIVINLSLDWRRHESRRADLHATWVAEAVCEHGPGGGFPDEWSRRIQAALDRLPAKQRSALIARLESTRVIGHDLGYGIGDDMDSLLAKYVRV